MSDITFNISFPLDDENYFRRECPYCKKQFKIKISEEDLNTIIQDLLDTFLAEDETNIKKEDDVDDIEYYCPYCGQLADKNEWWTEEQLNYSMVCAKNIAVKIINEKFTKEMKKNFGRNSFIQFKGKELDYVEPWISPEENDMVEYKLPCCEEYLKLSEELLTNSYQCFYCGFEHKIN